MNKITFDEVKVFTVNQLWDLKKEITENTCLAQNFLISGHDGYEYMQAFSKRFEMSLEKFDYVKYFDEENSISLISMFKYMYYRFIKRKPVKELIDLPRLKLGHLLKCANLGKWTEP